jgi:hypothetical protein
VADKLEALVERYFSRLRDERGLGGGTKERSFYPALADLFNGLGKELKPKVLCLSDLANTGAGHPDFGSMPPIRCKKAFLGRVNRLSEA